MCVIGSHGFHRGGSPLPARGTEPAAASAPPPRELPEQALSRSRVIGAAAVPALRPQARCAITGTGAPHPCAAARRGAAGFPGRGAWLCHMAQAALQVRAHALRSKPLCGMVMASCEGCRQTLRAGVGHGGPAVDGRSHGLQSARSAPMHFKSWHAARPALTAGCSLSAPASPSPPPPAASRPAGRSCHPMSAAAPHRSLMTPCRDRCSPRAWIGTLRSDRIILFATTTTGYPLLMQSAGRDGTGLQGRSH